MQRRRRELVVVTIMVACAGLGGAAEGDVRWVHPLCRPLDATSSCSVF
jgi:hypothetical protein